MVKHLPCKQGTENSNFSGSTIYNMKIDKVTNIFPTFGERTIEINDGEENLTLNINELLYSLRLIRFTDKEIMDEFHAIIKNSFTNEANRAIIWNTIANILVTEHYLPPLI